MTKRPLWQKIAAGTVAAALYVLPVGCGNGKVDNPGDPGPCVTNCGDSDPVNGENPIKDFTFASIEPKDVSSAFGPSDSPLEVGLETPGVNPAYNGPAVSGVDVLVTATGDNGTVTTSDDWTSTLIDQTAGLETYVSSTLNLATANNGGELKDGEKVTLDYILSVADADGTEHTRNTSKVFEYEREQVVNPVRVLSCYVNQSSLGTGLAMQCNGESDNGSITSWGLTTDLSGVMMGSSGAIFSGAMGASDVGLHTYTVTCTDGTDTSDDYVFTVPVDEHSSRLVLHCQEGNNETLKLPETSVDAVAQNCGVGFNPANKPDVATDPDYVLDVDHTCVQGAIDALPAAEKEAHTHYNAGTTVGDVYTTCTVDFAQASYLSNNNN
ncbi:MAG: hypothetical protein ABIA62_07525 [Candidatus Woesearchaeota archaeon]